MDWKDLKSRIYHEDGSLRDIFIRNLTLDDWKRWADYVNGNYAVDFFIAHSPCGNQIDFDAVAAYFQDPSRVYPAASIHLEGMVMHVNFWNDEMECDIAPIEIKSMQDHETLLDYLKSISGLLGRCIELTEENPGDPKEILMIVDGERVVFPGLR